MRANNTALLFAVSVFLFMFGTTTAPASPDDRSPAFDLAEEVMTYLGFDTSMRQDLLDGEILFTGQPDLEPMPQAIAVAGAMILIRRSWQEVVDFYLSEKTLRVHTKVLAYGEVPKGVGDVGVLEGLSFEGDEQAELHSLLRVKPGNEFNLSLDEIQRFQAIEAGDSAISEAVRLYREVLWDRVESYRQKGLRGMAPYARKSGEQSMPAEEMEASLDSAQVLRRHFPQFHEVLKSYPTNTDRLSENRLLWIKKEVSYRPMASLMHRMVWIEDDAAVAAEREFYVGHSYNSMLTLVGTAPYADGTLVFAAVRTFTEKVAGSGLKKSIGRKLVGKKFAERFEKLRAAVEAAD